MEFLFEFFAELILTPIVEGVVAFVGRIIPKEKIPDKLLWIITIGLGIVILGALLAFVIGLCAFFCAEEEVDKLIGKRLLIFGLITFAIAVVIRIFNPVKEE